MSNPDRIRDEVEELHAFFQAWYAGDLPDTDEAFARFASVLDHEFQLVSPDGRVLDRETILSLVRGGRGSGDIRLSIRKHNHRHTVGTVSIVTYEEWQARGDDEPRGRQSTAVFREKSDAPNGVAWLHVQETWMPDID